MKKYGKMMILASFATMSASALVGCAGYSSSLQFWVYGSDSELATFNSMTEAFNASYGQEHDIDVSISSRPSGSYTTAIRAAATTKSGPDVFLQVDDNFKKDIHAGLCADITEEMSKITDIDTSDIFDSIKNRFRYDIDKNTQNADDPIYGLPVNAKPTAIYYNETFFENADIIVISVDEDKIDKWNNDEVADNRGVYKKDIAKLDGLTIPKKGFYRSENPYSSTRGFRLPGDSEIMVFNNRIAMNWDEIEDIGMIFTPSYNPTASEWGVDYGLFTEWWFSYGWSVGGNCLTDISGNHDWNFSLLDPSNNYIVTEGNTYTGEYTGRVYRAGETLTFTDRLAINKDVVVTPTNIGTYEYDGVQVDVRDSVKNAESSGILHSLPSIRDAFTRYLKLGAKKNANIDGEGGLDIAPNPDTFNNRSYADYFFSGKLAMCVNYSVYMNEVAKNMTYHGWEWDVAPLPIYKQYINERDPDDDSVEIRGLKSGHSNTTSMVVRKASAKKDQAAEFIAWMASKEGQAIRVEDGWFPNQESLVKDIKFTSQLGASNYAVFAESLEFEQCGDWMYLPEYEWVNVWAVPLNSDVRNGRADYEDWYRTYITLTNEKLKKYN